MNTGALRHLVLLDRPDGAGGFAPLDPPTWWCNHVVEGALQSTLIGRYHPGITTATRVHFRGRVLQVVSLINRDERNQELSLSCQELFD